ncbi:hypothetical protein WJX79_002025 [Trebouxia sp. C0005]
MTPHLPVMLRCSLDKPALPKPETSLYQRPPSFQEGFAISAFQYGDKQPDKRLAALPSVYPNTPKSMLAEELHNDKVTGKEVAPLGKRVHPFDSVLLARQSLQKRRDMLEERACGKDDKTLPTVPWSPARSVTASETSAAAYQGNDELSAVPPPQLPPIKTSPERFMLTGPPIKGLPGTAPGPIAALALVATPSPLCLQKGHAETHAAFELPPDHSSCCYTKCIKALHIVPTSAARRRASAAVAP